MPFTLAHPAAVLPLVRHGRARGKLVGSALVLGAMAPDVPYFAGAFALGDLAHAWAAVPTLDLAITVGLAGVWHLLLRVPLVGLLPARWAAAADQLTAPRERGSGSPRCRGSSCPPSSAPSPTALGTAYRAAEWARPGMPWTSLVPVLAFGAVAGAAIAVMLHALLTLRRV